MWGREAEGLSGEKEIVCGQNFVVGNHARLYEDVLNTGDRATSIA